MKKRDVLFRRVVFVLCAGFVCAAAVSPGGVRAAMPDEEFVPLCGGSGTADQVRQALKDGANPNARDEGGGTALMAAMPYCDAELARLLLDGGADVNARDESGWTALMKVGAPVTDVDTTEEACLATARALLAAGADVNAQAESGASALSELEGAALFRALLAAGADVNRRNQAGRTSLMAAIASGRPDAARRLLNAGADPGLKDNDGHDAAWHARHFEEEYGGVEMSEEDVAKTKAEFLRLLEGGAKKPGGVRAQAMSDEEFIELCEKGTAEQVAQALKDGANARAKAPWADGARHDASVLAYSTSGPAGALHAAALNPNPEVTRLLLEAGAGGVNDAPDGWTPLMLAVSEGNLRTTRVLLDRGADVNFANKAGNTALIVASMLRRPTKIVAALLEAGADRRHKDKKGHDALWHARNVHITLSDHDGEKIFRADLAELIRLLGGKTAKKPSAKKKR